MTDPPRREASPPPARRHPRTWLALAAALATGGCPACDLLTAPDDIRDHLDVTVGVSAESLRVGDPIEVTVTIESRLDRPAALVFPTCRQLLVSAVRTDGPQDASTETAMVFWWGPEECGDPDVPFVELPPRGSLRVEGSWDGIDRSGGAERPVTPGTWSIRASVLPHAVIPDGGDELRSDHVVSRHGIGVEILEPNGPAGRP